MCSRTNGNPYNYCSRYGKDLIFSENVWNLIQLKVANVRAFGPDQFWAPEANDQGGLKEPPLWQIGLNYTTVRNRVILTLRRYTSMSSAIGIEGEGVFWQKE